MMGINIWELIIVCVLSLLMITCGITLLMGHGSWMIAGYNTKPKEEKEKYDHAALCRFVGKIVLPIGIGMPSVLIGEFLNISLLSISYGILILGLSIFAVIYTNTGNRFRK
jgi:hypothetical protein